MNQRTWQDELTSESATALYPLGTQRWNKDGTKRYRYVQYDNGTANITAVANIMVIYKSASLGAGTFIVTPDISDGDGSSGAKAIGAGQLLVAATDQYYLWIQVEGLSEVAAQDMTAGAVGDELTGVGANDGEFDVVATGYIGAPCGILVVATASSQKVFLQCP